MDIEESVHALIKDFTDDFDKNKKYFHKEMAGNFPIVWFGDLHKYSNSERKVVSIGINPSGKEFEVDRFDGLSDSDSMPTSDQLEKAFNNYFSYNPYTNWFNNKQKELIHLGSTLYPFSFYKNSAIHIEYETGIATKRSWSSIDGYTKNKISNHDNFKRLYQALSPDIAVINCSEQCKDAIKLSLGKEKNLNQLNDEVPIIKDAISIITYKNNKAGKNTSLVWVKNSEASNRCYGEIVSPYLDDID